MSRQDWWFVAFTIVLTCVYWWLAMHPVPWHVVT